MQGHRATFAMTQQPPQTTETSYTEYEDTSPYATPQAGSSTWADPDRNLPVPRQSHIISTILAPALKLWLRSQVEHVEDLEVLIEGGDRQLLQGIVPRLTLSARDVVYQGLAMSRVRLVGRGIQVNFRQILRGKPLQLSRTIPVQGEAVLTEDNLNDSLQTPMLTTLLSDVLVHLLRAGVAPDLVDPNSKKPIVLDNFEARLHEGRITLAAELVAATQGTNFPLAIRTGLRVVGDRQLRLEHPEWLSSLRAKRGLPLDDLDGYPVDLGTDVQVQDLILEEGRMIFRGHFNVYADEVAS